VSSSSDRSSLHEPGSGSMFNAAQSRSFASLPDGRRGLLQDLVRASTARCEHGRFKTLDDLKKVPGVEVPACVARPCTASVVRGENPGGVRWRYGYTERYPHRAPGQVAVRVCVPLSRFWRGGDAPVS
jgi:hypothetical protein